MRLQLMHFPRTLTFCCLFIGKLQAFPPPFPLPKFILFRGDGEGWKGVLCAWFSILVVSQSFYGSPGQQQIYLSRLLLALACP